MPRQKLKRFFDSETKENIVQPGKLFFDNAKGRWNEGQFPKSQPIVLEVGCGRGEYTVGLARQFSHNNHIGIDIKGGRLWVGADEALQEGFSNVAFLRTHIANLDRFFAPDEVADIWIPFPDPRPRNSDERRRLTSPRFLEMYRQILQPGGTIRLKTDNKALYEYTLEILKTYDLQQFDHTDNLYQSPLLADHHGITTAFENRYLAQGQPIHYIRFSFTV